MQEYFELNCQGMGLIDLWGIFGFAQRREYDPNNPRANILMPGKEGVSIVLLLQDNLLNVRIYILLMIKTNKNIPMWLCHKVTWGFPAIVSVDTTGTSTATSIGTKVAETFTAFSADPKKTLGKIKKQNYVFRGEVSKPCSLASVSKYIMDDNVVALFMALFAGYDKEELLLDDELLKCFFVSAEEGRNLLEFENFTPVE